MMKTAAALSALVLAVAAPACTSSPDDDLTFETDGGKADSVRPYGHFERALAEGDYGFTLLDLREDRTYDASQELVTCDPGKCTDTFSGTYRFASSHGNPYIVLYNDGDPWYSFEYKLAGDELQLRTTGTSSWFSMTQAAAGLELDDSDNNGTFDVTAGDDVVVKLGANATTGYKWVVTATDRSFGYPEEDYVVSGPATGSGGTSVFTWKTSGPFPLTGAHSVTLEFKRPWDTTTPAEKTFEFTVNVQ
jgi:predicted secreted protein